MFQVAGVCSRSCLSLGLHVEQTLQAELSVCGMVILFLGEPFLIGAPPVLLLLLY